MVPPTCPEDFRARIEAATSGLEDALLEKAA